VQSARKADNLIDICGPTVWTMWDSQHLTNLQAFTPCSIVLYMDYARTSQDLTYTTSRMKHHLLKTHAIIGRGRMLQATSYKPQATSLCSTRLLNHAIGSIISAALGLRALREMNTRDFLGRKRRPAGMADSRFSKSITASTSHITTIFHALLQVKFTYYIEEWCLLGCYAVWLL
jgi:hypothetical protein